MTSSVQRFLLFATLFLGISQLGKHFWPYFAYVSGIRVDYLSPTLYVSDILIIMLVLVSLPAGYSYLINRKGRVPLSLLFLIGTLSLGVITAKYAVPAFYAAGKAIEMIFFGYMVSRHVTLKDFSLIAKVLSVAILVEGLLVFLQMIKQSSVGGIWYYLGERTFSSASIGISTVSVFGKEILRSYGSFPHPNILAFFMVTVGTFFAVGYSAARELPARAIYLLLLLLSFSILLSTFSRTGLLVFLGIVMILMVKRMLSPALGSLFILAGVTFSVIFLQRFGLSAFYSDDFSSRIELAKIGLDIISKNLLFGVGLNNFYYHQIDYQREISPVLLQPPHNVYLLILLHTGILGFAGSLYFILKTLFRARFYLTQPSDKLQVVASVLFIGMLLIGLSDHYFLTLQQGMLMAAFIIGMVWIPEKTNRATD